MPTLAAFSCALTILFSYEMCCLLFQIACEAAMRLTLVIVIAVLAVSTCNVDALNIPGETNANE